MRSDFLRFVSFLRFFCALLAAELLAAETGAVAFPASSAVSAAASTETASTAGLPDAGSVHTSASAASEATRIISRAGELAPAGAGSQRSAEPALLSARRLRQKRTVYAQPKPRGNEICVRRALAPCRASESAIATNLTPGRVPKPMQKLTLFLSALACADGLLVGSSISGLSGAPLRAHAVTMATEQASALSSSATSIAAERYVATNRFRVKEGREAAFEKRWADRQSRLGLLDGFRFFCMMRRVEGKVSCTPQHATHPSYTSLPCLSTSASSASALSDAAHRCGTFEFLS